MSFSIFDVPGKRALLSPDRIALQDVSGPQCLTYRDLHIRTGRTAALLAECGVGPGDRVAVLCRNRCEFFELLFACARLSAILVPLNWRMPVSELSGLLSDCRPGWLIHGSEDAHAAGQLAGPELQCLDLDANGDRDFAARRDRLEPHTGRTAWPADETWYLLYTSGTTGVPKAVIQTYGMALANYVNISQAMGLRGEDTTLCYLPLFHTGGINLLALPALMMGARVLLTPGFDLEQTMDLLDQGRLDTFFGVPAVYQAISLHPRFDDIDLGAVRCWGCGGAPLPDDLFRRFDGRGATVLNGMGMTETGPTVFLMDAGHARDKMGSVGKPQLLCQVRLVDTGGRDVARGQTGELWFAGPGVTPGYYISPTSTERALVDGVWLRSGDLARQDDDGYYHIVGRLKDMYISGGENVYPAEVENQLMQHPDVLEAAVIGVPDARWGETGCAYLLPRPGHDLPDRETLTEWCRQYLAAFKVPRYFLPVSEFPRTAAGKIQKHQLPLPDGERP